MKLPKYNPLKHSTALPFPVPELSSQLCLYPPCRKRMTIEETKTVYNTPILYCTECIQRQNKASRDTKYTEKVLKHFQSIENSPHFIKLNEFMPGIIPDPPNYNPFPTPPSPLLYIHFLKFHKTKYEFIANTFSKHYFPNPTSPIHLPPPDLIQAQAATQLLHIVTTQKTCKSCQTTYPTYQIPNLSSNRNKFGKLTVVPRPNEEFPVTYPQIITLISYIQEKKKLTKEVMTPTYFARSYGSKDMWNINCKVCCTQNLKEKRQRNQNNEN